MKITVPGHRILVKPVEVKKTTESGIIIEYAGNEDIERASITIGTVVQIGPDAFKTMYINGYIGTPWCKVGDEIYFAKYTGKEIQDTETGVWYRVLSDEDVVAVISKEKGI